MAVNYSINASVVDIRTDAPVVTDKFLVDTCVWFWIAYTKASVGVKRRFRYQLSDYPRYISSINGVGASLHHCGLSFSELSHLIEKTERELFIPPTSTKEFRHNYPAERASVVGEITTAWGQVKALSSCVTCEVSETTTDDVLVKCGTHLLDGYDLFILRTMIESGVIQILTDDGDYATVPGITVFTANPNVIDLARSQGKLMVR